MSTYIAHPVDEAQEKAVKAFFDALQVPYEAEAASDDTEHLLSTEANRKRLLNAMEHDGEGHGRAVSLDEIWK